MLITAVSRDVTIMVSLNKYTPVLKYPWIPKPADAPIFYIKWYFHVTMHSLVYFVIFHSYITYTQQYNANAG